MNSQTNALAWGHDSILSFFENNRHTTKDIYPSEWFFLQKKMVEGIKLLDIGCAKGGMANVLSENISSFEYVGVDINHEMIASAKKRHPNHQFHHITDNNYTALKGMKYDVVLCLGILHLHETWRDTLKTAWEHTSGCLILDLRETHLKTIENKEVSYFKMDFDHIDQPTTNYVLPYNIINTSESLQTINDICINASKILLYGYTQSLSALAVSPIKKIMANVYCIER